MTCECLLLNSSFWIYSTPNVTILLSILCEPFLISWRRSAWNAWIIGSVMYFTSTGMSHSQIRKLLSLLVTNRLFSSTNVMVFTTPKCLAYSYVISSDRISLTFLSLVPATKRCYLSGSGLNLTQYGIFLFVKRLIHAPVSVSQSFTYLS